MNKYTEKLAKLTAEQSRALAEAMNANYNNPPADNNANSDTDKAQKADEKQD